jgi:hypothetical protein
VQLHHTKLFISRLKRRAISDASGRAYFRMNAFDDRGDCAFRRPRRWKRHVCAWCRAATNWELVVNGLEHSNKAGLHLPFDQYPL